MSGFFASLMAGARKLAATLSTTLITESVANGTQTLSGSVTCNVSGETGSVTHSWTRTLGDAQIVATNPTGATTGFESTGTNQIRSATFKDTVTDSVGSVDSNTIDVDVTHGTPP